MKLHMIYFIILLIFAGLGQAEIVEFTLQSSDTGELSGPHSGRPYHIFNDSDDEAVYITASDWQGGHNPDGVGIWPISDGFISWEVFTDPNGLTGRPPVITYDPNDNLSYVFWNSVTEDYQLDTDPNASTETLQKLYYEEWGLDSALNFGNTVRPSGAIADRQNAVISEFKLERPYLNGLNAGNLISAYIEVTIDDVVDMSLNGHNMVPISSKLFVNSFIGDGIVGRYENAQEDFNRIDHENADTFVWLTIDNTEIGSWITDFNLSWYKLVDPGLGQEYSFIIDVTDSVQNMLSEDADFAGFVLSGSPDGEYCLASIDLVIGDMSYLPKLVIAADVIPLTADFDLNNKVDLVDFSILSRAWETEANDSDYNSVCDIEDPNGLIDLADFEAFTEQWLLDYNR